jgi:hypothetical protein
MKHIPKRTAFWIAAIFLFIWSPALATPPSTPITIDLSMSRAPRQNEQATVTVTVKSRFDAPATRVELVLPDGVVATPRTWSVNLRANVPIRLSSSLSMSARGNVTVSARAFKQISPDVSWGDMKSIPLTVAGTSALSRFGWTVDRVPVAGQASPGNVRILSMESTPFSFADEAKALANAPSGPEPSVGAEDPSKPARALIRPAARRGTVTLTGNWTVHDRSDVARAAEQMLVEIRKGDGSALSPQQFCFTDNSGNFSCSFPHPGTTMRVFLRSWTNFNRPGGSDRLGVFNSVDGNGCGSAINCSYPVQTGVVSCADGATCNVGSWFVSLGVTGEPWIGAHQMTLDLVHSWKRAFFDNKHGTGVSSGPARIGYPVPSGHGTHAHVPPGDGWIAIEPPNQRAADIVVHEYGHVVMANLWTGFTPNWPPFDCPSPHFLGSVSGPGCALFEGWADFWAWYSNQSYDGDNSTANDGPIFNFANGSTQNLETRDSGTFSSGDQVEGNVAAVMGDLMDFANDGPLSSFADRVNDGIQHVWHTTSTQSDNNFAEWWAAYQAFGHAACPALEVIRFNSIGYTLPGCAPVTLAVSASPSTSGAVTGGGSFLANTTHTISAFPNANFAFVNWTEGSSVFSNSATTSVFMTGNRSLVANFAPILRTITLGVTPTNTGTVTGAGTFQQGSTRTVVATAKPGFRFLRWTEGSTVVSNQKSFTFTLNANRNLVAHFGRVFRITLSAAPANGGTMTGAGIFSQGSTRTVVATAKPGFTFVAWTEGTTLLTRSRSFTFTLTRDRNLVARFRAAEGAF